MLFIQTAFIGDAVLVSALLEKWHAQHPQDELFLLVRKGNEAIYDEHPFLKNCLTWNKKEGKYRSLWKLLKRIRKEQFDVVVNPHRFASSGFLTAFSGAKHKMGFDKNPLSFLFSGRYPHVLGTKKSKRYQHEVDRNQALISSFTEGNAAQPQLYPLKKHEEEASAFAQEAFFCIAPASVWATKAYPKEHWVELLAKLKDFPVVVLGGPSDRELAEEIILQSEHPLAQNACGKLSFLGSAALMKRAKMNLVNDSAPLHFASSVNAPVCAIYCSTIPQFGFGPTRPDALIVEVEEKLACRPCGLHGHKACPKQHFNCAHHIDQQRLVEIVRHAF